MVAFAHHPSIWPPLDVEYVLLGPVWREQFIEWVDIVDVVCAKLLFLLGQEEVTNLNK